MTNYILLCSFTLDALDCSSHVSGLLHALDCAPAPSGAAEMQSVSDADVSQALTAAWLAALHSSGSPPQSLLQVDSLHPTSIVKPPVCIPCEYLLYVREQLGLQ